MHRFTGPLFVLALVVAVASAVNVETSKNPFQLTPSQVDDDGGYTQLIQLGSSAAPIASPRMISGVIALGGRKYQVNCKCANPDADTYCRRPEKVRIRQEPFNSNAAMSKADLKKILGGPDGFSTLLRIDQTTISDSDPREAACVVATPGADFFEFVVGLSSYESATKKQLTQPDVQTLLKNWLSTLAVPMTYPTDEDALYHLKNNLHINGQKGAFAAGLDITSPPRRWHDAIIDDLKSPVNQGSRTISMALENPGVFYLRKDLIESAIESLFRLLWSNKRGTDGVLLANKINVQIQKGKFKPKAWLNVRASGHCEEKGMAPCFTPTSRKGYGAVQTVVVHPAAVSSLRKRLARFFVGSMLSEKYQVSEDEFFSWQTRSCRRNLELVAESVGVEGIPFFTITPE